MISESVLKKRIEMIMKELIPQWLQHWEFSLWITTDGEIRSLNRTRRNIDRPTDVLSFPLLDLNTPLPIQILGEVVISWDRTMEQAIEIGHTEEDEFYRLLVHGILHLFGYDHETSIEDEKIMKAKEDEILTLILGEGVWD
ncbi:MAG: rRNA maturation RNase YbeY [Leptospira sp.]|nr:rRNA maturation RNase YbeY [Leptospira sp.]